MFDGKMRGRQIEKLQADLADLGRRVFFLEREIPWLVTRARTNRDDIDENEKAIALILHHLDLEYIIIPKHPEVVAREKPPTDA